MNILSHLAMRLLVLSIIGLFYSLIAYLFKLQDYFVVIIVLSSITGYVLEKKKIIKVKANGDKE